VYAEQHDSGTLERYPTLDCDLPEVLVEGQNDAGLKFGQLENRKILPSGALGSSPEYVMAFGAKCIDSRLREVLICE
jgi:hypothetical protein